MAESKIEQIGKSVASTADRWAVYCFLWVIVGNAAAIQNQTIHAGDLEALLDFQATLANPFDDWQGDRYCKWYGVQCSTSGRVIGLEIGTEYQDYFPPYVRRSPLYRGHFGAALARLDRLRTLHLRNLQFDGPIPGEWGSMPGLVSLILTDNNVAGSIPPSLGNLTSLRTLRIERQALSSVLPSELCRLGKLKEVRMDAAGLLGPLPDCLGRLHLLEVFAAAGNPNLIARLPASLANLTNLRVLRLSDCGIVGRIPRLYGELRKLRTLALDGNNLEGRIPDTLGNISSLSVLDLGSNQLRGFIPRELANLQSLSSLSLDSNRLRGSIPASLGNLSDTDWRILGKRGNRAFNDSIPAGVACVQMDLSFNYLEGEIPASLGNLTPWSTLSLYDNRLAGAFPVSLLRLTGLFIDNNRLTSLGAREVPPDDPIVSVLDLRANRLRGPIPQWMSALRKLARLDLSMNELSGDIPPWLEALPSLQYLNLSHNHLKPKVP